MGTWKTKSSFGGDTNYLSLAKWEIGDTVIGKIVDATPNKFNANNIDLRMRLLDTSGFSQEVDSNTDFVINGNASLSINYKKLLDQEGVFITDGEGTVVKDAEGMAMKKLPQDLTVAITYTHDYEAKSGKVGRGVKIDVVELPSESVDTI